MCATWLKLVGPEIILDLRSWRLKWVIDIIDIAEEYFHGVEWEVHNEWSGGSG